MQEQIQWKIRKIIREAYVVEGYREDHSEGRQTLEQGLRPIKEFLPLVIFRIWVVKALSKLI